MPWRTANLPIMVLAFSILSFVGAAPMSDQDATAAALPPLFPRPQEIAVREGRPFTFGRATQVYDGTGGKVCRHLRAMLERAGGLALRETSDRAKVGSAGVVAFVPAMPSDGLPREGYALRVTERAITVKFADEPGAFYAVQTLRQLLPNEIESREVVRGVRWTVPQVEIRDWPRFSWRGMHLDVSRHFFPPEFIKRYIDFIALHKMNRFHWHLTDDGGWRMQVTKYPKLTEIGAWRVDTGGQWPGGNWNYSELRFPGRESGKKLYGGFYTKEQIREIVSYAKERFVTVVPEIEMPGHSLPALVAYPEFGCDGVEPFPEPGFHRTNNFCPGKDGTLKFLQDVLAEALELFPSEWIHIGADEVWKGFWQNCPSCQRRIREQGLQAKGDGHSAEENLQSWFVRRMEDFLWRNGRRLIGWDEILEGGLSPMATVMSWRGVQGGVAAARSGHEAVMSPTSHCYFDYSYATTSVRHVYGWEPVPEELDAEQARNILGGQANVWTEWIPTSERVEYMVFPRMLATAEVLWLEKARKNWEDFASRLGPYYARLDAMQVAYHIPAPEVEFAAVLFEDSAEVAAKPIAGMPFSLRYTTDGTVPSGSSPEYRGPIGVTRDCTVAFAYVNAQGKPGETVRVQARKFSPPKDLGVLVQGLRAEYYEGEWRAVPDFSGLKAVKSMRAPNVGLDPSARQENFALRFTGYVEIPREGVYTFSLLSDDGSVLWLAGTKLVDNDGLHAPQEKSASIRLRAGLYPVEIGFFQLGGARALSAFVEGPEMPRRPIGEIARTAP